MRILKFEGASMREALAKVKAELGDQAVVVSTRQIKKGLLGTAFEIAAAIEDDPVDRRPPAFVASAPPPPAPAPVRPALADDEVERVVAPLRAELRSLRASLRARTDDRAGTAVLRNELAALRKAVEELRPGAPSPAPVAMPAPAAERGSSAATRSRVVMLVGPTGVGKTTTIAKIAAHAALVEHRRVALVTLDNYRVGGVEQIRTFADLIGTSLHVVTDASGLAATLDELADHDLTLVDTAGRSPRDHAAIATLERALAGTRGVEVHLTAPAVLSATQLDELHARYAALRPQRLLITKVDECDRVPELVAAPARLGLPITWLTTGQAVPEDLEVATPARLAALAQHGLDLPDHRAA